jgi:hypothetical protein
MTSCDRCVQLLPDYAAACNQVIELKRSRDPLLGLPACAKSKVAWEPVRSLLDHEIS